MAQQLTGMRIAMVATDGFEQSEPRVPRDVLRDSGAHVEVLAPHDGRIQPGGVANPDALRTDRRLTDLMRESPPRFRTMPIYPSKPHP
jgi:protease I